MTGTLDAFSKLATKLHEAYVDARGFGSLSQYTKGTTVRGRLYIDGSVVNEPVMSGLASSLQIIYCGMVLTALRMNQFIGGGKTLKELLHVVATEDMKAPYVDIASSMESFNRKYDFGGAGSLEIEVADSGDEQKKAPIHSTKPAEEVERLENGRVPVGRVIELEITNAEGKVIGKIPITVQLMPYVMAAATARQFIVHNSTPGFLNRLAQLRAGEISFWRDFIFGFDIAKSRGDAKRQDKSGILVEHANRVFGKSQTLANGLIDRFVGNAQNAPRNVANYLMVFSEQTAKEARVASSIDLHKYSNRQKFMESTFGVMLAIVDPMFNRVTMYYSGIEDGATFPYDAFKQAGKGGTDPIDLVRAMQMMQQGQIPRF